MHMHERAQAVCAAPHPQVTRSVKGHLFVSVDKFRRATTETFNSENRIIGIFSVRVTRLLNTFLISGF